MNFREDLVRGIYAYGFERPSTIQQRTIKPMVTGQDVITQAQSAQRYDQCHVFYQPESWPYKLRRIGRSVRFGCNDVAINFTKADETKIVCDIEQFYSTMVVQLPMNIGELIWRCTVQANI